MITTAILVDGAFYRRRINNAKGLESPTDAANTLYKYCQRHIVASKEPNTLYRVFYYDCPPSCKKVYHPILKKTVDLSKSDIYEWSNSFLNTLKQKRKFALRLGNLSEESISYSLCSKSTKKLLAGELDVRDITDANLILSIKQKGVDMRIGIDIVSLALKSQVNRIVLIAGDSDFVPAAKLARREGIDFVLDPMWAPIRPELNEHIDGLKSFRLTERGTDDDTQD